MCFSVDDPSDIWNVTHHQARKAHDCDECSGGIQPGQRYQRIGSLSYGQWTTYRTCSSCLSLREAVVAHEIAEGCRAAEATPPMGELWFAARDAGLVTPRRDWDDARENARDDAVLL